LTGGLNDAIGAGAVDGKDLPFVGIVKGTENRENRSQEPGRVFEEETGVEPVYPFFCSEQSGRSNPNKNQTDQKSD